MKSMAVDSEDNIYISDGSSSVYVIIADQEYKRLTAELIDK